MPGTQNGVSYTGDSGANAYLDLTKVSPLIPVPSSQKPFQPAPLTDRSQQMYVPEFGVPGYSGFVMERELHGAIPEDLLRDTGMGPAPSPQAEPGLP